MSNIQTDDKPATKSSTPQRVDMKLEVAVLSVADVDRAKTLLRRSGLADRRRFRQG